MTVDIWAGITHTGFDWNREWIMLRNTIYLVPLAWNSTLSIYKIMDYVATLTA